MNELISIITPAYNVERYIEKCINSVLRQTYKEWELIIIDDGSADGTGKIADRYAAAHENICVVHQNNRGVSSARNRGLELARGSYILFLDADDWIEEEMLKTMTDAGQQADLIVCGINDCIQKENGDISSAPRKIWEQQQNFLSENVYLDILCKTATLWNKLIRVDCIGSTRFCPEMTYGEDVYFLARVLPKVRSAVLVPRSMYNYLKVRSGNVVSAKLDDRSLQYLDNSVETYRCLKRIGKGVYGVFRLRTAVNEILAKIEDLDDSDNRRYIKKCGASIRETDFRDRAAFMLDSRFEISLWRRAFFLMLAYCPKLAIRLKRMR